MYLVKLYKHSKILFTIITLYIAGVLYYAAHQREEFPFLLYGMYSLKETGQNEYVTYQVKVNGVELDYHSLPDAERELITSPLYQVAGNDSTGDVQKIKAWLGRYLARKKQGTSQIDINRIVCTYGTNGSPFVLSNKPIAEYAE
jgi:hypothetical protein